MNYNKKVLANRIQSVKKDIEDLLEIFVDVDSNGDDGRNTYTDADGNTVELEFTEVKGHPAFQISILIKDGETCTCINSITASLEE